MGLLRVFYEARPDPERDARIRECVGTKEAELHYIPASGTRAIDFDVKNEDVETVARRVKNRFPWVRNVRTETT